MRAQSAQFYAGSNTALTGLVAIEQNGIVWNDSAECEGLLSVGGFSDIESQAEKGEVQMSPRGGFVTDNENLAIELARLCCFPFLWGRARRRHPCNGGRQPRLGRRPKLRGAGTWRVVRGRMRYVGCHKFWSPV